MKLRDVVRHKDEGHGIVVENWCDDSEKVWVVLFDGKKRLSYHYESDLTPVDVKVREGLVEVDATETDIGMVTVDNEDVYNFLWANGFDGKRVRITIEVID